MPNVLPFVNSERIETYAQALKNSTGNDFGSDIWSFTDRDGTRESRIHFSSFSEIFSDFDLNIAKAFIAYILPITGPGCPDIGITASHFDLNGIVGTVGTLSA